MTLKLSSTLDLSTWTEPSPTALQTQTPAIALIDTRLADWPTLVAALDPAIQPYILHPEVDVFTQIEIALQQFSSSDRLLLFGHGAPGQMWLGSGILDKNTVKTHAAQIAQWQVKQILLYGCHVGQSSELIESLHHLTGANVAASRTTLGQGQWDLEVQRGCLTVPMAVTGVYRHTLPVEQVVEINTTPNSGSFPYQFTVFNNHLYTTAYTSATGRELWEIDTNGTARLIADIAPGSANSYVAGFSIFNNALYFQANDRTTGEGLWRIDTNGTVSQVITSNANDRWHFTYLPATGAFPTFNNTLYFGAERSIRGDNGFFRASGYQLWQLDVNGNVSQVTDSNGAGIGGFRTSDYITFNNEFYFSSYQATSGRELWRIDANGTASLIQDLSSGSNSSNPRRFTAFNNALYFTADDGIHGNELWQLDANGNVSLVSDINPGSGSSNIGSLTLLNNTLYFTANDGSSGQELWRLDTNGGVSQVADLNAGVKSTFNSVNTGFTVFNNNFYFTADDGINGYQIWRVDEVGALYRVTDIDPDGLGFGADDFTVFDNALYFASATETKGYELWRLDADNTVSQITNINPDAHFILPGFGFTVFNNSLYFRGTEQGDPIAAIGIMAASTTPGEGFDVANLEVWRYQPDEVVGDFSGDKKADFLWRNEQTGANGIWVMDGNSIASVVSLPTVSTNWDAVGIGDFSGDARSDILWRDRNSGATGIWVMDGTNYVSSIALPAVSPNWEVLGVGDFGGSHDTDIYWRDRNTGHTGFWMMNGATIVTTVEGATVGTDWVVGGVGDFNGDSEDDLVWNHRPTGSTGIWLMTDTSIASIAALDTVEPSWFIASVGDYNQDGHADITWRNQINGAMGTWLMQETNRIGIQPLPTVTADSGWNLV